jgi:hypothetical protein
MAHVLIATHWTGAQQLELEQQQQQQQLEVSHLGLTSGEPQ